MGSGSWGVLGSRRRIRVGVEVVCGLKACDDGSCLNDLVEEIVVRGRVWEEGVARGECHGEEVCERYRQDVHLWVGGEV